MFTVARGGGGGEDMGGSRVGFAEGIHRAHAVTRAWRVVVGVLACACRGRRWVWRCRRRLCFCQWVFFCLLEMAASTGGWGKGGDRDLGSNVRRGGRGGQQCPLTGSVLREEQGHGH